MSLHMPGDSTQHTDDPCDLCGSLDRELLSSLDRKGQPLLTGICRPCGMVAHWQRPTEAELQAFYASEYRLSYHGELTPSPRRVRRAWVNARRIHQRLKSFLRTKDSVFEVGAGIGCTVKAFEMNGHRAAGIDPGEGFQRFSQEELRADVHNQNLFDLPGHPQHDLVLLIHVIEHFHSPRRALEHIHKILQPNGLLYVECPNLAAPFALRSKLFHFAHITNFTPSSLRMLAESCGFSVVQRFNQEQNPNLQVLLKKSSSSRFDIDDQNYSRTLAAIQRYNWLTYSLRPSYLVNRVAKLASYANEHLISSRWLNNFIQQCRDAKPIVGSVRLSEKSGA